MSKGPGKWQIFILDLLKMIEFFPLRVAIERGWDVKDGQWVDGVYSEKEYQALMRAARSLERAGAVRLAWVTRWGRRFRYVGRPGVKIEPGPARTSAQFRKMAAAARARISV